MEEVGSMLLATVIRSGEWSTTVVAAEGRVAPEFSFRAGLIGIYLVALHFRATLTDSGMIKPILVTGAHRSGSTWVGKVIGSERHVRYVHEPFNVGLGRDGSPLKYWFEFLSSTSDPKFQGRVEAYLKSFILPSAASTSRSILRSRSLKEVGSSVKELGRRITHRTLIKDPIAVMSTEWIHQRLGCDVVMLIRHPAAFVASLKAKSWYFDFRQLLMQRELMERYLEPLRADFENAAENEGNIVRQGILQWNAIYSVVLDLQRRYSQQWIFTTHESLSREPMKGFESMFTALNLEFSADVRAIIEETTSGKIISDSKRNAAENVFSWSKRLSDEQIEMIKKGTYPLWSNWYSEADWRTAPATLDVSRA